MGKIAAMLVLVLVVGGTWLASARGMIVLPWQDPTVGAEVNEEGLGPLMQRPERFREQLAAQPWFNSIRFGKRPVGAVLEDQIRFSVGENGSLKQRRIYADTPAAAALLDGATEEGATRFLHGLQRLMHDRGAYVQGISLATSQRGFEANSMLNFVLDKDVRAYLYAPGITDADRRLVVREWVAPGFKGSLQGVKGTHRFEGHWIDLDPEISGYLRLAVRRPEKLRPIDGLYAATVLRHELEHAVSAYDGAVDHPARANVIRWIEEGTAMVITDWPGEAARSARMFGVPYPKRAERQRYSRVVPDRVAYTDYMATLRPLLIAAGVDVDSPRHFGRASQLLQGGPVDETPWRLADAIIKNGRAKPNEKDWLVREIINLRGEPPRARALSRELR